MITLLVVMTVISASMRLIPFAFSKWLIKWKALEKLSATLPLCISILLVAHLLKPAPYVLPELTGLAVVVGVHLWLRNLLLSMAAGVCTHQMLIHFL